MHGGISERKTDEYIFEGKLLGELQVAFKTREGIDLRRMVFWTPVQQSAEANIYGAI